MFLLLINNWYILIKQDSVNISQHAVFLDRLFLMMAVSFHHDSPASDDDAALLAGVNWTAVVSVLEFSRDKSSDASVRSVRLNAGKVFGAGGLVWWGGGLFSSACSFDGWQDSQRHLTHPWVSPCLPLTWAAFLACRGSSPWLPAHSPPHTQTAVW